MKTDTRFGRFVNTMDEMIPEPTTENFKSIGKAIMTNAGHTAVCATATVICLGNVYLDVGITGLMVSKGIVKKTAETVKGFYATTPVMTVCR